MTRKKKLYNKVTNPIAEFRKMNEARMGKVIKSYPKYVMGGPGDGNVDDVVQKRAGYVANEMKLYNQANKRKALQMLRSRKKMTKKGDLFGTSYAPGDPRKTHGVDKDIFKYLKKEIKSKYK